MISITSGFLEVIPYFNWSRVLKNLKSIGFDGIELQVEIDLWPIALTSKIEDYKWIINEIEAAGLKITGINTTSFIQNPITSKQKESFTNAMKLIEKMIEIANILNVNQVTIAPGDTSSNAIMALPIMKRICDISSNTNILLENVPYSFSSDMKQLLSLTDCINRNNIGICLDIGNAVAYGNIENWILTFNDEIKKIHISDYRLDEERTCSLGAGSVNWVNVKQCLEKINYHGDFVLEFFPNNINTTLIEIIKSYKFMKHFFEEKNELRY